MNGAVAPALLDGNQLRDVQVIWRQVPPTIGRGHFGHRLVFGRDGTLFITSGDRMRFDPAQDPGSNLGKVVRIATDGSIPADNPFVGQANARGDNYDESPIPDHRTRKEFEPPVRTWTPVISPSGALFYRGSLLPWRGKAIVGGLSSTALIRLTFDGTRVVHEERIDMQRRIRDVAEAADGSLLVITDDREGELLRVTPAPAEDH